jgi:hypothetical protein
VLSEAGKSFRGVPVAVEEHFIAYCRGRGYQSYLGACCRRTPLQILSVFIILSGVSHGTVGIYTKAFSVEG